MALEIVRDAKDNTIDVTRITSIIILIAYYLIVRNLLFLSTCNDQVGIYESSRGIIPVFFMLFLGLLARKRQWITFAQNEGAKKLVFTILFPLLVYKVLVTSELKSTFLIQIIYMDIIWLIVLFIGFKLTPFTGKKFAHISPYLLVTCEGGNVALPLYISIVGAAHAVNIVTFDVAGILINFGVLPILVTKKVVGR